MSGSAIEHEGRVSDVAGGNVYVTVERTSACGTCDARQHCGMVESQPRELVFEEEVGHYRIGDPVIVCMEESTGKAAVIFAYLLPLALVVIALLVFSVFIPQELVAGGLALVLLIPYYTGLYLFRSRFKKKFKLTLQKRSADPS